MVILYNNIMLLELRAITYGWWEMPKETLKSSAVHHVTTRGRNCMHLEHGTQCSFPTSTSGKVSVAMEIPKQGVNTSTIAIDNFISHPFLMHEPQSTPSAA